MILTACLPVSNWPVRVDKIGHLARYICVNQRKGGGDFQPLA